MLRFCVCFDCVFGVCVCVIVLVVFLFCVFFVSYRSVCLLFLVSTASEIASHSNGGHKTKLTSPKLGSREKWRLVAVFIPEYRRLCL